MAGTERGKWMVQKIVGCFAQDGVDAARKQACELLLAQRVGTKGKTGKAADVEARMHITQVTGREGRPRLVALVAACASGVAAWLFSLPVR